MRLNFSSKMLVSLICVIAQFWSPLLFSHPDKLSSGTVSTYYFPAFEVEHLVGVLPYIRDIQTTLTLPPQCTERLCKHHKVHSSFSSCQDVEPLEDIWHAEVRKDQPILASHIYDALTGNTLSICPNKAVYIVSDALHQLMAQHFGRVSKQEYLALLQDTDRTTVSVVMSSHQEPLEATLYLTLNSAKVLHNLFEEGIDITELIERNQISVSLTDNSLLQVGPELKSFFIENAALVMNETLQEVEDTPIKSLLTTYHPYITLHPDNRNKPDLSHRLLQYPVENVSVREGDRQVLKDAGRWGNQVIKRTDFQSQIGHKQFRPVKTGLNGETAL